MTHPIMDSINPTGGKNRCWLNASIALIMGFLDGVISIDPIAFVRRLRAHPLRVSGTEAKTTSTRAGSHENWGPGEQQVDEASRENFFGAWQWNCVLQGKRRDNFLKF